MNPGATQTEVPVRQLKQPENITRCKRRRYKMLYAKGGRANAHSNDGFATISIRSHAEVGRILGLSTQRVQQLECEIFRKLRYRLREFYDQYRQNLC